MKRGERGSYSSTGVTPEVKLQTAKIAVALEQRGMSLADCVEVFEETDYAPKLRTLQQHVKRLKEGQSPLSESKSSGRNAKLTEEEELIVCGAVLAEEDCVGLLFLVEWIGANFGKDVSTTLCSRLMKRRGVTFQLFGTRSWPKGMIKEEYVKGYFEFVKRVRDDGIFTRDAATVICIDSCTNSVRIERKRGLSTAGGRQPVLSAAKPEYTNCYVTAVTMNGTGEFKTYMYTYDPVFADDAAEAGDVQKWCDDFGVKRTQIVYEKPAKGSKKYNAENHSHYKHYLNKHKKELRDTILFHDGGPAFKKNKQYVFEDLVADHYTFPAAQHGRLSVCDNYLFGIAKTTWRRERSNKKFSMDAVKLIQCIDWVGQDSIMNMWEYNFLLMEDKLTLQAVEDLMDRGPKTAFANQEKKQMYLAAYGKWSKGNDDNYKVEPDPKLECELDGGYWKN
jgi:transposase